MTRETRSALIRNIEEERNSRVIVYVTGDRKGLETRIATDIFPFALELLARIGKRERLDLFIYSAGGLTMAGYALVNLLREYAKHLGVIVPFKAHSCATLIALGADEIIMTPMAELSPVDPSVASALGPQITLPGQPFPQTVPVNVEDVAGYIDLARKELGLKDGKSLAQVLDRLAQSVHPLTLGSVNRIRQQIAFLAETLLGTHEEDSAKAKKIVETLTKGRFSHDYLISRHEAKHVLGLNILEPEPPFEKQIVDLYREYDEMLQLSVPYLAESVLQGGESARGVFDRAVVESTDASFVFRTTKDIKRIIVGPPASPIPTEAYQEKIISESWVETDII